MKYLVIATHWDEKKSRQAKYIAGSFDSLINAVLFKEAYNNHYHADASVVEAGDLVEAFYE